jgi:branched-chain amino acid transport system permease protein
MRELAGICVFCALVALTPLFIASGSLQNLVIMTLYATLLGQAWNILAGFGGQFSFGHAVFFGSGAYAMAVLQVKFGWNAWAALAASLAAGSAVGAFIGALSFRYGLKGSISRW